MFFSASNAEEAKNWYDWAKDLPLSPTRGRFKSRSNSLRGSGVSFGEKGARYLSECTLDTNRHRGRLGPEHDPKAPPPLPTPSPCVAKNQEAASNSSARNTNYTHSFGSPPQAQPYQRAHDAAQHRCKGGF